MAVKTNLDLTKEISKELQRLNNDVMEMTKAFEKRRETVEKHCGQCRNLFKPWPSKVVQLYHPNTEFDKKSDETDEKSNCCDSPSNPDSEREKEELAMLDDILAKAHHARDLQNKMLKPNKKPHLAKFKSPNLPTSQVKEEKPKPKVSYPVLKRPPSARSTYAASYTKPPRPKTQETGTKKTAAFTIGTTVPSEQELRKQRQQEKTREHKTYETKKCTAKTIGTPRQIENKITSKLQSREASKLQSREETKFEPNSTAHTRFLISEKGSTLSMPDEFQRIYKDYKKLKRRVEKARISLQLKSEEQFVKKVEESFCPKLLKLPSVEHARRDVERLEKKYKELLSFVKVMALRGQADGSSDSLKCWGNVISTFRQLNEEAKILKENLDFLSEHCPLQQHKSVEFGEQEEDLGDIVASSLMGRKFSKRTNMDNYFTYHNMKEFKMLLEMSYNYKIMTYQLDLRMMLGETMLPLLQRLPANHKTFVPLCRSVYSILCCEGKTFPTVVKDSVPED